MMRILLTVIFSLIMASVASANSFIISCDIKGGGSGGVVTSKYLFARENKEANITVFDSYIKTSNNNEPLPTRITSNTNGILKVAWNLRVITTTREKFPILYRAEFNKNLSEVKISGTLGNHPVHRYHRGKCVRLR